MLKVLWVGGKWGLLLILGVLVGLIGWYWWCAEEINTPLSTEAQPPLFVEALRQKFPSNTIAVEEISRKFEEGCNKLHLKIRSRYGGERGALEAIWWSKSHKARDRVLIFLPITGSGDPGKLVARYFSMVEGFDVLQFLGTSRQGFLNVEEWGPVKSMLQIENAVGAVDYFMGLRLSNYLQIVSWLKLEQRYRDAYVLGISLGAIEASLVALDENVRATALVMGGGDMAEILMYSQEAFVIRWRQILIEKLKNILGRTPGNEEVLKVLRDNFKGADPLRWVGEADPRKILMILAKYDESIPAANGMKLWRAAHRPRLIIFPTTHRGMASYAPAALYHISRFFKQD